MDPWESWLEGLAVSLDVDGPGPDEVESLLSVARDVAHRVERKATPLATFLLGMSVQRRLAAGEGRDAAVAGAVADVRGSLPPAS